MGSLIIHFSIKSFHFESGFRLLYRANVLGAICGTIAASFIMVELMGLKGTLLLTAIMNFIIAGTALIYSYHILNLMINQPVELDSPGSPAGQRQFLKLFAGPAFYRRTTHQNVYSTAIRR